MFSETHSSFTVGSSTCAENSALVGNKNHTTTRWLGPQTLIFSAEPNTEHSVFNNNASAKQHSGSEDVGSSGEPAPRPEGAFKVNQ